MENVGTPHAFNYKLKKLVNVPLHIVFGMIKDSFVMIKNAQTIRINMNVPNCHFVNGLNTNV